MIDGLKPCPLCRSDDVGIFLADDTPRAEVYGLRCLNCDLTLTRASQEKLVEAWNRRVTPAERINNLRRELRGEKEIT